MMEKLSKVFIIVMFIMMFFAIDFLDELQNKTNLVLSSNLSYNKNLNALNNTECLSCHIEYKHHLPRRSNLSLNDFITYVRGDRDLKNNLMPNYDKEKMSDEQLTMMYMKLYM